MAKASRVLKWMAVLLTGMAMCNNFAQTVLRNSSVFGDTPPEGAPTAACDIIPVPDASKLLVLTGDAPLTFVFACGKNRPVGVCATMTAVPGSQDLPRTARYLTNGLQQNGWSCVQSDSVAGWIPTNRLSPLPAFPAVTSAEWLGWWRQGKDAPGIKNDRLLITRGSLPRTLHVSGRAYWYGLNDNVHFGEVQGDASAYGDTLLVVDGQGASACTVVLVYQPARHDFLADDNMNCGGMNVRFLREWQRFIPGVPDARHTKH